MQKYALSAVLTFLAVILFLGCENPDIATLEICLIDAYDYDQVHCSVTQENNTVFDRYLEVGASYQIVKLELESNAPCAVSLQCYLNNTLVYNCTEESVSLQMGEKTQVMFYIQIAPFSPTNLTAVTEGSFQVNLSWNDNSDNEYGFVLERKIAGGEFEYLDSLSLNTTQYSDSGLSDMTQYTYRVYAYNNVGNSGYSNSASAVTPAYLPQSPSNLFACFDSTITLTWDDNATNEEGCRIERKVGSAAEYTQIAEVSADVDCYIDEVIELGNIYHYRIYAFNGNGVSGYSNTATTASIQTVGVFDTPGNAQDIEIVGNIAYIADCHTGLGIYDISNPFMVNHLGQYTFEYVDDFGATAVAVSENYAFVLNQSQNPEVGFHVLDISDPENIYEIAAQPLVGGLSLEINGDYAYASSRDLNMAKLHVFDISDPFNVQELTSLQFELGNPLDLEIQGNFLYLPCGTCGLIIVDISNPATASVASAFTNIPIALGVTVSGDYAYVSGGFYVKIINIANPFNPFSQGWEYEEPEYTRGICARGDKLYMLDWNESLMFVADKSNPTQPRTMGVTLSPGYPVDLLVIGNYAYISGWTSGLQIMYVGDY